MPRPPALCSHSCSDEMQIETGPPKPPSAVKEKTQPQYDRLETLLLRIIEDVNRNMCDVKNVVEEKINVFDQTLQAQMDKLGEIDRLWQGRGTQQVETRKSQVSRSANLRPSFAPANEEDGKESLARVSVSTAGLPPMLPVLSTNSSLHAPTPSNAVSKVTSMRSSVLHAVEGCRSLYTGSQEENDQSGVVSIEELPVVTHQLFEAVRCCDESCVRHLLEEDGDPNLEVGEYHLIPEGAKTGRTYKPCSLLGLAVLEQHYKMAELLIQYSADPDSIYGFCAGAQRLVWSAPCSHATVAKHNINLLELLILSRADPHARSSSGANLVWQCAYFAKSDMLSYLLDLGVSPERAADHPDMVGVSHPSLHIAAIRGHHSIVASLLAARAKHNATNEMGMQALDDAILQCRPSIVSLLVAEGADLFGGISGSRLSNSETLGKTSQRELHRRRTSNTLRPIDRVFLLENPVVMSAVAEGLWTQEKQTQRLTINELVNFLSTPGDTPAKILKAVFRERRLFYWEQSDKQIVRKDITTAFIPKPRVLPSGVLAENMNVASLPMSYSDFSAKGNTRAPLSPMVIERLSELVPQQPPTACFKEEHLMTSVSLYESLIQDVHKDLLVIATISKLHHRMLCHKPTQAILQHCWTTVYHLQIFDVFVHLILMLDFIVISIILQHPEADFGMDRDFLIRVVACLGLFCAAVHFIDEVLQCVAFEFQGWLCDYMTDVGNYIDYLRIGGDLTVLIAFCWQGRHAADTDEFRVIFAFSCFYKWLKLLSSLKPFRAVGPQILPILEAMRGVGAFFLVLLFYMIGLWHSYITLEPGRIRSFDVWYMVYRIALIGDYTPYTISDDSPATSYYIVRVFYMLVALLITITLMNVFIAALSNEFNSASDNIETIFEQGRVSTVLSHMAVRAGIRRMMPKSCKNCKRRNAVVETADGTRIMEHARRPQETLWFCVAARDRSD